VRISEGKSMSASSRRLTLILRATAVLLLLAFIGALLPERVMRSIYESGEIGPSGCISD